MISSKNNLKTRSHVIYPYLVSACGKNAKISLKCP